MNLHITPSFNIDRLCKTASVLLFSCYVWNHKSIEYCYPFLNHMSIIKARIDMHLKLYFISYIDTVRYRLEINHFSPIKIHEYSTC